MIGRRHQVALALTMVLAAAAACQNQRRDEPAAGHPAPPATAARGFTLLASGSIVPDATVADRAGFEAGGDGYDFRPMLAAAQPAVAAADLALCQLDPVPAPDGGSAAAALPQLARTLAAMGYDSCATAFADARDDDGTAVRRTLDALDDAGVRHAGTARTQAEARSLTLLRAGPATVAHLSYTDDPGRQPLSGGPGPAVRTLDERQVIADARAARRAGADVVVLSVQWGNGTEDTPDPAVTALARRLTASKTAGRPDIDLVLGADGRIPQAYRKVNGTWVVYGTGDQIAGATATQGAGDWRGGESATARFTFAPPARPGGRWQVSHAEFLPLFYDADAGRLTDVNAAITQGADLTVLRDRVRQAVLGGGAGGEGLVMGR